VEQVFGKIKPSADRMGEVMGLMEPDQLRQILSRINHQLGRNKALRNDWPLRVAVFDGHEFFSSRHRCCPLCCQRMVSKDGKGGRGGCDRVLSLWDGLLFSGIPDRDASGCEMIQPGEGIVIAARRLLERVLPCYGRFFDVALTDALYLEAPFYKLCLKHHKHVISVLKGV